MADAFDMSTVHANRRLQDLRKKGILMLCNSTLMIRNSDGLAKVAKFDPACLHIVQRAAG